jgi:hypothetical protein
MSKSYKEIGDGRTPLVRTACGGARRGPRFFAERSRPLLLEGAMALMLIHGDRGYAKAAARAAKTLVQKG